MPNQKKKKILLLCDDLTMTSGISTMAREIVLGTVHRYDYCQLAGAIKHPHSGKIIDLSQSVKDETKVQDAYVRLYPVDGYGNEQILFTVMDMEKPDAIFIFTDPRYWEWLFALEHQIRQKIPIIYWNIWDNLPFPQWNKYSSVDCLLNISKQTQNLVKWTLRPENCFTLDGEFNKDGEIIKKPLSV